MPSRFLMHGLKAFLERRLLLPIGLPRRNFQKQLIYKTLDLTQMFHLCIVYIHLCIHSHVVNLVAFYLVGVEVHKRRSLVCTRLFIIPYACKHVLSSSDYVSVALIVIENNVHTIDAVDPRYGMTLLLVPQMS